MQSHSQTEMTVVPGGIPKIRVEVKMKIEAESIPKMGVAAQAQEGPRMVVEAKMEGILHMKVKGNLQPREMEMEEILQADVKRDLQNRTKRLWEEVEDQQMKTI